MTKKINIFVFSCLLLLLVSVFYYSLDHNVIPWLYKINFYYRIHNTPYSKGFLDTLSRKELDFIQQNIDVATVNLRVEASEFEVAGAINDYLYQLLLLADNTGSPLDVLWEKHAICGGHALAMSVMLEKIGIANRLAYLIDVPYQGAHSMVEVTFKDGRKGLYDPAFGSFWYDIKKKRQLSISDLKQNPEWADANLFRTAHKKRTEVSQKVDPFFSVADHYASYMDQGKIHYKDMFEKCSNAGVNGYEFKVYRRLRVGSLPALFGSHELKNISEAVLQLALAKDDGGRHQSWLHILGKQPHGENIAHIYEFDNLQPGAVYKVSLFYVKSVASVVSATVIGGKFKNDTSQTKYCIIEDYGPKLTQLLPTNVFSKSRTIEIQFVASKKDPTLILSSEGEMLLHAIEFR